MAEPIRPAAPLPGQRRLFRTLGIAASGLTAQRLRMETVAMNVANAETTRTEAGGPYRRRVVEMEAVSVQPFVKALEGASTDAAATSDARTLGAPEGNEAFSAAEASDKILGGVRVVGIAEDPTEGPLVYEPGHPDANTDGYVRYPNVRITDEMVDLMDARRLYEANATVFQAAKAMLRRAIDI